MRLLVTGFDAFDATDDNPSAHLARTISDSATVLPVTYQAVDDFLLSLDPSGFDAFLMLGFSNRARKLTVETVGRNRNGSHADVSGVVREGVINPSGPDELPSTLWTHYVLWQSSLFWHSSQDAGGYLCNYILYRALESFPDHKVGFIHVPDFKLMPMENQIKGLEQILARCAPNREPANVS